MSVDVYIISIAVMFVLSIVLAYVMYKVSRNG